VSLTRIVQRRNINPTNVVKDRAWTTGNSFQVLAGTKRCLVFVYGKETTDVPGIITAVSLNGVPGTILNQSSIDTGFAASVSIVYWLESQLQTIGIGSFVVSVTSNGTLQVADGEKFASIQFSGVDQTTPFTNSVIGSITGDGLFSYPDIVRNEGSWMIASNCGGDSGATSLPLTNFTTQVTISASSSNLQVHDAFDQSQYNEETLQVVTGNNRMAFLMAALNRSEAA
jgi:hypothetical protein